MVTQFDAKQGRDCGPALLRRSLEAAQLLAELA